MEIPSSAFINKLCFGILCSIITCSCKSKSLQKERNNNSININNTFVKKTCPEDGTCHFQVLKHKTLVVKKDHFGATYLDIQKGNQIILKFEYTKHKKNKNIADSGYKEEIFIALSPKNIVQETTELSSIENIYFARWCFCKGQTGYYNINQGNLSIKALNNNTYKLHVSFKVDDVPQVIHDINETFSL